MIPETRDLFEDPPSDQYPVFEVYSCFICDREAEAPSFRVAVGASTYVYCADPVCEAFIDLKMREDENAIETQPDEN